MDFGRPRRASLPCAFADIAEDPLEGPLARMPRAINNPTTWEVAPWTTPLRTRAGTPDSAVHDLEWPTARRNSSPPTMRRRDAKPATPSPLRSVTCCQDGAPDHVASLAAFQTLPRARIAFHASSLQLPTVAYVPKSPPLKKAGVSRPGRVLVRQDHVGMPGYHAPLTLDELSESDDDESGVTTELTEF